MIDTFYSVTVENTRDKDTPRCGMIFKAGEKKTVSVNKRQLITLRGTLGFVLTGETSLKERPEGWKDSNRTDADIALKRGTVKEGPQTIPVTALDKPFPPPAKDPVNKADPEKKVNG